MNNRQSKPTGGPPSGASIWGMTLAWLAADAVTFWMAWSVETTRELAGTILGFLLGFVLLGLLAGRLQRRTAAVAAKRHAVEEALERAGYGAELMKPGPY